LLFFSEQMADKKLWEREASHQGEEEMATKKSAKMPVAYQHMLTELKGDRAHCAVIAIAAITRLPAKKVQETLTRCGRKIGTGTSDWEMSHALKLLGFKVTRTVALHKIIASYPGPHNNLKNVTTHHPRRFRKVWADQPDMLMFSGSHVSAFVDGKVVDWAVKKSKIVAYVWTVEKVS